MAVSFLILLSCGEHKSPTSDTAYFLEKTATGNESNGVRTTLACKMGNGQYCFYEKSIAKDRLLPKSERKQQEGSGLKLAELVEGSTLLTPRSIEAKELRLALQSGSKWNNRAADVGNYVGLPITALCFGTIIFDLFIGRGIPKAHSINSKISMVSCLPVFASAVLQLGFLSKATKLAKTETLGLLSTSPHLVSTEDIDDAKKILTWLENLETLFLAQLK